MKKRLILLGAMLAMALLVAAPAVMAQTADLSQSNTGDVISTNDADQTADQRQYAPGGDAQFDVRGDVDEENETDNIVILATDEFLNNNGDDFDVFIFDGGDDDIDTDVDQEGGDGGTQEIDQRQTQNATATGATFGAAQ